MAFNLSKNNDPVPEKKRNVWVVIILLVMIVGGVIWYFIPKKETAAVSIPAPIPVTTPETDSTVIPSPVPTPPRIAASFNKGTAAPVAISDEIVKEIRQGHEITIYGYASSEGDLATNLQLATDRAASFKQYLISQGVDEKMITAVGKGIDNPIAPNDTETGRAQNRRVEVHIK